MKKLLYFLPAAFFYSLVFFLSSKDLGIQLTGGWLDKLAHLAEFAILGGLLAIGFFNALTASPAIRAGITWLTGLCLGALDEYHQVSVPDRIPDLKDFLADGAGIAVGIVLYIWLSRRFKRRMLSRRGA